MDEQSLRDLRFGRVAFSSFARDRYITRMTRFYASKVVRIPSVPIDEEDIRQIVLQTIWEAVREYEFRCGVEGCSGRFSTDDALKEHRWETHGRSDSIGAPSLERYVHGRVGNALDHEVRRYTRRRRFYRPENPEKMEEPVEIRIESRQEVIVDFRMLVERAIRSLDPTRQRIFEAMAFGDDEVEGVSQRKVRRERERLRQDFRQFVSVGQ